MKLLDHPGITEITSKTQKKNGTRVFALETNKGPAHFGIYDSGYVRVLPSKGNRVYTCYQMNKTRKVSRKCYYIVEDDHGNEISRYLRSDFESTVRILIPTEEERMQFLMDYIEKNYKLAYTKK